MGDVWIDSVRCFDAIARLRSAAPVSVTVHTATVGDGASDEVLGELAVAVERSGSGVAAAQYAMADDAILTALRVISADRWWGDVLSRTASDASVALRSMASGLRRTAEHAGVTLVCVET